MKYEKEVFNKIAGSSIIVEITILRYNHFF